MNIIVRSVKPSEENQASGGTRPAMILNYGLKYSDFDRMIETIPTIRKVLPIREIRKQIRRGSYTIEGRVVGTTEEYARRRFQDQARVGFEGLDNFGKKSVDGQFQSVTA